MRGIKIPPQDFVLKMQGGHICRTLWYMILDHSAKRARNVPGHAHLPSPPHAARYPSSRMLILLSNCLLGRIEAVVTES